MRKQILLILFAAAPLFCTAQTVADFESPVLSGADTFYLPLDSNIVDNGFDNGLAHFPLHTDKYGSSLYWGDGFAISNYNDSVRTGPLYQYAARTGKGVNGSAQYAVVKFESGYGDSTRIILKGRAKTRASQGFYATNTSYAYYTMKNGDGFIAKKFGDTTHTHSGLPQGTYPDFFRVIIQGYRGGILQPDTVEFYLADYRSSDSTKDYIVKDWRWVSLMKLGAVDSLKLRLESSDTNSFGGPVAYLNNPSYFCMDDFTTGESLGVPQSAQPFIAKVFPNPAHNVIFIEPAPGAGLRQAMLYDMIGKMLLQKAILTAKEQIDLSGLPVGSYTLRLLDDNGKSATSIISKQ